MSFMDHIPHKWALNKSLRKEADKLKSKLDSYQIEYERRMKACQAEIDKAQLEKEADLEKVKESLEKELQLDQEMYEALLKDLVDYADTFLRRKFLCILQKNKSVQADIISEDIDFFKTQMNEIRAEITLLQERKSALSAFTNVQDIIALTNDCGYDIHFSLDDDADNLLRKVNEAIDTCSDDRIKRISLFRLRGIVYERSEYLSTIKYIEWIIQQKVDNRVQLRNKMLSLIDKFKAFKDKIQKIDEEIEVLDQSLEKKAEHIRFYWMKPITRLNSEIDYALKSLYEYNQELTSKKHRHKSICSELKEMKEIRSHDQARWVSLQSELEKLSDDINHLKAEIEEIGFQKETKNVERDVWYDKRNKIKQSFKKCHINWESNKTLLLQDEKKIIAQRINELEQITKDGAKEAEEVCQQEKDKLISEYTAKREAYLKSSDELNDKLKETTTSIKVQQLLLSGIREQIKKIKDNDNRFFLAKWLSELPELTTAKQKENTYSNTLSQLIKSQKELQNQINDISSNISDLKEKHEQALNRCRPKPLRPTSAEKREEEMLKLRLKNIREKRNGNKN